MAELVDALDLGSSATKHASSNLAIRNPKCFQEYYKLSSIEQSCNIYLFRYERNRTLIVSFGNQRSTIELHTL